MPSPCASFKLDCASVSERQYGTPITKRQLRNESTKRSYGTKLRNEVTERSYATEKVSYEHTSPSQNGADGFPQDQRGRGPPHQRHTRQQHQSASRLWSDYPERLISFGQSRHPRSRD